MIITEDKKANMEIAHGIHAIPTDTGPLLSPFMPQVYLAVGGEGALIDSGYGDEHSASAIIDYVNYFPGLRLSYIIITHAHPDHINGSARLKEITGATIVIHSAEQSNITADKEVGEGDIISLNGIDLEIVHTPGHSPGHICLYIRKDRVMFSGDQVVSLGTTAIHPPQGDMKQYIDSLRKLLTYDIELICPGHGTPIRNPRKKLEELINHRQERQEQIIDGLHQGKATIKELAFEIYPELTGFLYEVAKGQVYAHLIKLENEGKVCSQISDNIVRYELVPQRQIYA
jgi:glyoxylase-like metal-dependent hydrolase (beta-lactamase superfamily II)